MTIAETIIRAGAVTSNGARKRQAAYRARMAEQGLVQVTGWVNSEQASDLMQIINLLRAHPELTVGPLRNPNTGRLVSTKNLDDPDE